MSAALGGLGLQRLLGAHISCRLKAFGYFHSRDHFMLAGASREVRVSLGIHATQLGGALRVVRLATACRDQVPRHLARSAAPAPVARACRCIPTSLPLSCRDPTEGHENSGVMFRPPGAY